MVELAELLVVNLGQRKQAADRPEQGEGHVGLGVPNVSLRTKERVRVLSDEFRGPPFDQFIKGAEGQADRNDEKISPSGEIYDFLADQNFPSDQGGNESLHEMPDLVVVVAFPSKGFADPIEEWDFRIGILSAHHQNDAMEQNPKIEQGSERKGLTGPPHDDQTDDSGSRFEYPS